tara:strand:- start:319 stop:2988 length:2670 start_codon:yes stop_codon:yes gene_type:complete
MKNKLNNIFLVLIFNILFLNYVTAEEFNFNITELQITESGNIITGANGGTVTTRNNEIIITAENFKYNKLTTLLEAEGNVKLVDKVSDIIIESNEIFYFKDKEEIYTKGESRALNGRQIQIDADKYFKYNKLTSLLEAKGDVKLKDKDKNINIYTNEIYYLVNEEKISTIGKTVVNVESKYYVEGSDLVLLRNKMILSSNKKTTITDSNSNVYKLDQFQHFINDEILKGEKVFFKKNEKEGKEDEHYFEAAFFDLKKNEFLGKDTNIKFHKTLLDDEENDPRVRAVSSYGDEYNTYLDKAVFTSCKKTDKCPPWKIRAKRMNHDIIKNQIKYDSAWLELYDFPVVYFPKFFHPAAGVKRQTGLLKPEIGDHDKLGDSLYLPYFFVISDTKDMTLKPRLFNDDKIILQNEYRQITENSLTLIDASITKGHNSSDLDKGDSRSHFFANTKIDLDFEKFINSDLEINFEKVSNDNYLKLFDFIKSPLWMTNRDTLNSHVSLNLEHENYDFTSSFMLYEALSGRNSDRYSYVLPKYFFSKNFFLDNINGDFIFTSTGDNLINQTNVTTTKVNNNLTYTSPTTYSPNGIKKNFLLKVKNSNSMSNNDVRYKNKPQSEITSAYFYNASYPFEKKIEDGINTFIPKLSLRLSPHNMKNDNDSSRRIDAGNVYSPERTGIFEEGESLTLGFEFKKEKINKKNKLNHSNLDQQIAEINEYFNFRLATNLRLKKEENISKDSTLGETASNIFGDIMLKPNEEITLGYNFSLTDDLNTFEYSALSVGYLSENFTTTFNYLEEAGVLGDTNVIANKTKINFNNFNTLSFSTRRNRTINLTEYYDVVYEYKNDCLIAGIKYRKDYYKDLDIIPKEELFFSLTIIPFYTFSPDKMILNKERID